MRSCLLSSIVVLLISMINVVSPLAPPSSPLPHLRAAVLVPGFLTGQEEFRQLAKDLTARGIPTLTVPFSNWHWLPCLGGRSMRPMLERLDYAVQYWTRASTQANYTVPPVPYTMLDFWQDFRHNPGGVFAVGGSDQPDAYPTIQPRGTFATMVEKQIPQGKIALIGHSAGGWISRIYLSDRLYGGRAYAGHQLVHSLVTLGTPHNSAPGPAFTSLAWCNQQVDDLPAVRKLAVAGRGFRGDQWGQLTQSSYSFCCDQGTDGTGYDGDGVTPIQSALAWKGADSLIIDNCTHFCWADTWGASTVAPELTADHRLGRPWYGTSHIMDQWVDWLDKTSDWLA